MTKNEFKKVAVLAALAGDSKKASPVRVYDLGGKSTIADFAVLMEVESAPQLDAVEEEVSIRLKQQGVYCLHKEGQRSKNWKVLDYGGVLVHVYEKKAEEFYAIAKHYADYKPVEWEEKPAPAPVTQARKPVVEAPVIAKPAAIKPEAKKPAVKKPAAKKPAVKKPAAKKPAVKKPAVKKPAAKKPAVKKPAVKKPVAKKSAVKKAAAKKPAAKKAAPKKSAVKKAPAKKASVKKAKPAAKKVSKVKKAKPAAKKVSKKKK